MALALSLGRLSASSNLCPRLETFDYRNLFLPHPALQHHADPQRIHRCPRHGIRANTVVFSGQVPAPSASIVFCSRKMQQQTHRALHRVCMPGQSLTGESWPCKQPGWAGVSPACSFSRSHGCLFLVRELAVRADFYGSILDFLEGYLKQVAPPQVRRRRSFPSKSPVSRMMLAQRSPFISTFRSVTTLLRTSSKHHGTFVRNHLGSHNPRPSDGCSRRASRS